MLFLPSSSSLPPLAAPLLPSTPPLPWIEQAGQGKGGRGGALNSASLGTARRLNLGAGAQSTRVDRLMAKGRARAGVRPGTGKSGPWRVKVEGPMMHHRLRLIFSSLPCLASVDSQEDGCQAEGRW